LKAALTAIIPTWNGEPFVADAVCSVLEQTRPPSAVVVVDDGSTDGTLERLEEFGDAILVVRQKNQGVSAARNRGAREGTGRHLAFLDQDDFWEPDFVERQLAALESRPECGLVYGDSWIVDAAGHRRGRRSAFLRYAGGWVFDRLLDGNFIPIESMVVRREVFEGLGGFDTTFPSFHAGSRTVPHAHNQLVHVLAETGLVGLVAFLFLGRAVWRAALRGAAALADDPVRRPLFHGAAAALLAGFVYFLFETPLHWPAAGGLLAVLLAALTRAGCDAREVVPSRGLALAGAAVSAVLLAASVAAWVASSRARLAASEAGGLQVRATGALGQGDLAAARELAEASLAALARADAHFPHRPEFPRLAAVTCQQLGRPEEALRWALLADARAPHVHDHLALIGTAHLRAKQYEEAVPALRQAVQAHQGLESRETYYQLSRALQGAHRWEEAWFIASDLVETVHYEALRPVLLLDTADTLLKLDRDLTAAAIMLKRYARLAGPDADEERLALQLERLQMRRERAKRVKVRVPRRERERPGEVWGGLLSLRVEQAEAVAVAQEEQER